MSAEKEEVLGKFADIAKRLNKTYGESAVKKAVHCEETKRLPSGIFSFDACTGGGVPYGRYTQLFGLPSSGKTSLATRLVAQAQKTCRKCLKFMPCKCGRTDAWKAVWIEVESTFDKVWASKLGVDVNELEISHPTYAEEALNIMEAFILAEEVGIIVLDSIAQLATSKEVEEPMENPQMADLAKIMNKFFRKAGSAMQVRKNAGVVAPALVMINQTREKVGVMYGSPETRYGGKGQLFADSVEVRMSPGKYKFEGGNEKGGEGEKPAYMETNFVVKKSKVSVAHMEGTYEFYLRTVGSMKAGDTNDFDQAWMYAKRYGVVENPGKGKWLCLGVEETTEEKLLEKVKTDAKKMAELRMKTLEIVIAK